MNSENKDRAVAVISLILILMVGSYRVSWQPSSKVGKSDIGGVNHSQTLTHSNHTGTMVLGSNESRKGQGDKLEPSAGEHGSHSVQMPLVIRERALQPGEISLSPEEFSFSPFPEVKLKIKTSQLKEGALNSEYAGGVLVDEYGKELGSAEVTTILGEDNRIYYSGRFALDDGELFVLTHDSSGQAVVQELNPMGFAGCNTMKPDGSLQASPHAVADSHHGVGDQAIEPRTYGADSEVQADASVVKVAVLYTDDVETALGGEAQVQALVASSISTSNTAFTNSEVSLEFELVYSGRVDYTETTFVMDLQRLANTSDGYLDSIPALREEHHADLVTLLVVNQQYCGLAYLMDSLSSTFAPYAYSTINHLCAVGNLSFPHELAHNMGSDHDEANASGGVYSYSYGWRFNSNQLRTVMAYSPGQRINYFSNPNVTYNGFSTGDASEADNARSLNQVKGVVAAFKNESSSYTISGNVTANGTPLANVSINGGVVGSAFTDESGNYSLTSSAIGSSYTITPSLANYTFDPVAIAGTLNKDATYNFEATMVTYDIVGTVEIEGGGGLGGVTVDGGSLGTKTTTSSGSFSFLNVPVNTNYKLEFSKTGYVMSPASSAGLLLEDVNINISAEASVFSISGNVTLAGQAMPQVEINCGGLGTVTTDDFGEYSLTNIPASSNYVLTPQKTGYAFSPASYSGVLSGNITRNFTAEALGSDSDSDGLSDEMEEDLGTDPFSPDTDGDGLGDALEVGLGLDPLVADSDGDKVSDGQEYTDGSNPLDAGSAIPRLGKTICAEWNGFLGGMWNILEHSNVSSKTLSVTTVLYNLNGQEESRVDFKVKSGNQYDLLVHDMRGRKLNTFGLVCSTHDGEEGALDGRMVYYKHESGADSPFEFAFSMPFGKPTSGEQYVSFNTYHPSLNTADGGNLIANWVQLSNLSGKTAQGVISFYDITGKSLWSSKLKLKHGERRDVSGHQWGPQKVGLIGWVPEDSSSLFQLRNVRYIYSNPEGSDHFDTAFQLEGGKGSGETLVAPLDTRSGSAVIEVSNTSASTVTVELRVFDQGGTSRYQSESLKIKPKASYHFISDPYLEQSLGSMSLMSSKANSVIATVMQYGRDSLGSIEYMYGLQARQTLGDSLSGSYNSFLGQGCTAMIVNSLTRSQVVSLSMTRYDGTKVLKDYGLTIAGHGMQSIDICSRDNENVYGTVSVQDAENNSLYGVIIRQANGDAYRFPTPLRR